MKPWLLNLILSIEGEFEAKHSKQSQALGTLQLQHNLLQQKYTQETAASAERVKELEGRIKKMEEGLNSAAQARLEVELKLKECEDALRVAEEGAAHATEMCAQLNEAMMLLNANDTRLRKQLATRAYNLKESLLVANSRLRTKADDARKSRLEVRRGAVAARLVARQHREPCPALYRLDAFAAGYCPQSSLTRCLVVPPPPPSPSHLYTTDGGASEDEGGADGGGGAVERADRARGLRAPAVAGGPVARSVRPHPPALAHGAHVVRGRVQGAGAGEDEAAAQVL